MTLYYKMRQILLQNATVILLQIATEVYYKMPQVFCYKMRQFYYKMRLLLQNATFITNCASTPLYKPESSFANTFQDFPKTVTFMFLKFWSSYFQG